MSLRNYCYVTELYKNWVDDQIWNRECILFIFSYNKGAREKERRRGREPKKMCDMAGASSIKSEKANNKVKRFNDKRGRVEQKHRDWYGKKEALSCRQAPIFQNTVEIKKTIKKEMTEKKQKTEFHTKTNFWKKKTRQRVPYHAL